MNAVIWTLSIALIVVAGPLLVDAFPATGAAASAKFVSVSFW